MCTFIGENLCSSIGEFLCSLVYHLQLVGFHGMEGSLGILSHTLRFDFSEVCIINEKTGMETPIGEIEMYCRWLGTHGIPVILVTGDREAIYEANQFNPYRHVCCVKSYFQTKHVDSTFLFDKLTDSVNVSLKLNAAFCVSHDTDKTILRFHNPDTFSSLVDLGYKQENGGIIFENCSELINELSLLASHLQQINNENWEINIEFLKEMRNLAKGLDKEAMSKSEAAVALQCNLRFLDESSREKIRAAFKNMVENL